MAIKHVPAHTAYVCDHCGKEYATADDISGEVKMPDGTKQEWCWDCVNRDATICMTCDTIHPYDEYDNKQTIERTWGDGIRVQYCPDCRRQVIKKLRELANEIEREEREAVERKFNLTFKA